MQSGLDVHYDLGEGHPLLGRRLPDVDLVTPAGPLTAYSLLHEAREPGALDGVVLPAGVKLVDARYGGSWELPVLGEVPAPDAVLVRPDGYVAWVGAGSGAGLTEALAAWFGPALG
jgi:hypothetical protein